MIGPLLEKLARAVSDRPLGPLDRSLASLASRHDVAPLLGLDRELTARRNLYLTGELFARLDRFAAADIPAMPLKGPVMTQALFGSLARRAFCDLDLLVPPDRFAAAAALLMADGYDPGELPSAERLPAYQRYAYEHQFRRAEAGLLVELHWALAPGHFGRRSLTRAFWERATTSWLCNRPLPAPAEEDLLAYLCLHGARHQWSQLKWICDVARLLVVTPALPWDRLWREARETGSARQLLLGLTLARDLLGAPAPRLPRDVTARRLAAEVRRRLFSPRPAGPVLRGVRAGAFDLRVRERLRDRLRFAIRLAVTPNLRDWHSLSLPRPLTPLYLIVRPVRLLGKHGLR